MLDEATVERLRRLVRSGGSVVVAAGPSRVGKSTLADALAGELPAETARVYVRGSYETFDFVGAAEAAGGTRTALLVNEISPHLPIYLWGQGARRVLGLARYGAQVIATMHADSPEEVIYQLARQPVGATPDEIAALASVVFLGPASEDGNRWKVVRIVRLHSTGHGILVDEIGA